MKVVELRNKLLQAICNEESKLLSLFKDEPIPKAKLSERQQELATKLTIKNILLRVNTGDTIYYSRKI
jgi:hypothetical protein